MRTTNLYLLVSSVLMLFCVCAGAKLRLKRSANVNASNIDSNGRCLTAKSWTEECNQCFCVENGVPACTLKGCLPALPTTTIKRIDSESTSESTVDRKCVPGSTWTEVCNSCWCTDDGLSICTKIGCVNLG